MATICGKYMHTHFTSIVQFIHSTVRVYRNYQPLPSENPSINLLSKQHQWERQNCQKEKGKERHGFCGGIYLLDKTCFTTDMADPKQQKNWHAWHTCFIWILIFRTLEDCSVCRHYIPGKVNIFNNRLIQTLCYTCVQLSTQSNP